MAQTIKVLDLPQPAAKDRVEFLSDGIFAVAMTLLVLDLKVPDLPHDASSLALLNALLKLWPKFGAFIISFLFLARNWYIHRLILHSVSKVDYRFSYLNILLLMINCVLPFTTALVSEYPHAGVAAAAYIGNMLLTPVVIYGMLMEAQKGGLLKADLSPQFISWFRKRHGVIVAVYLAAFPIIYFSPELSVFWVLCYQLFTALPPFFRQRQVE
jgi:uncharacterized membrane protein